MARGCCAGGRAGLQMFLTLMLTIAVTGSVYRLRRGHEPFIYKNIAGHNPQIFPFEVFPKSTNRGDEMKMMLGMCKEDRQVLMRSLPAVAPLSTAQNNTTEHDVQNIIENMVEVMEMEEDRGSSKDKMFPTLKKMVESVNSTIELQTRMAPQTSYQTLIRLQDTVLEFLAISGIDALLPLDCGRHPKKPEDPLPSNGTYPWIAALGSNEDGRFHYRCTGVLISQHHVLTDADCVFSPNINLVMMNVTDAPGPGAVINFVAGRRVHPTIKGSEDLLSGNNIGILELALPYQFNDYIQPICLPGQFEEPDPNEKSEVTIVGYQPTDFSTGRMASRYILPSIPTLGSGHCFRAISDIKEKNPEIKTTLEDILTKKHLCVITDFELAKSEELNIGVEWVSETAVYEVTVPYHHRRLLLMALQPYLKHFSPPSSPPGSSLIPQDVQVGKSVILRVDENTGRVRVVGLGAVANAAMTRPIAYTLVQPHRFWVELVLKKFKDNTAPRRPTLPPPDSELET